MTTPFSALLNSFLFLPTNCVACCPSFFLCLQKCYQWPVVGCISRLQSDQWARKNGYIIHLVKTIWLLNRFRGAQMWQTSEYYIMSWKYLVIFLFLWWHLPLLFSFGSGWFDEMAGTWASVVLNINQCVSEEVVSLSPSWVVWFDWFWLLCFYLSHTDAHIHAPTHYIHHWYLIAHLDLIFVNEFLITFKSSCVVSMWSSQ